MEDAAPVRQRALSYTRAQAACRIPGTGPMPCHHSGAVRGDVVKKPVSTGWPESALFPFLPRPMADAAPPTAPLIQGMATGIDLLKDFWGKLPGGAPIPGFLVPTVDVDELDKRIADLRAAESWVEVNLNLLRTTIQGLEVQRNTIAAIQSLSSMTGATTSAVESRVESPPAWAAAAASPSAPAAADATSPAAPEAAPAAAEAAAPPAGFAAANWLGYLQDQFARVAQAALAVPVVAPAKTATKKSAARKKTARPAGKAASKTTPRP